METKTNNNSSSSSITRYLYMFALGLFLTLSGNAEASTHKSASVDSTWTLDTTVGSIKCYHKVSKCGDMVTVFVLFDNTGSGSQTISWDAQVTSNRSGVQSHPNGKLTMTLLPGLTKATSCGDGEPRELYIMAYEVDDGNDVNIYSYRFANCSVK
jgi:hypothetical protein